jgi:hypothetical protein
MDQWTAKQSFMYGVVGAARNSAVGFSIGNNGYVGTGYVYGGAETNQFWKYGQ